MLPLREKFKLIGLAVGIFICHLLMGIVIEIIFKTDYNGEKFNFPVAFVAVKNITYAMIAKGDINILFFKAKIKTFYILCSTSNHKQSST